MYTFLCLGKNENKQDTSYEYAWIIPEPSLAQLLAIGASQLVLHIYQKLPKVIPGFTQLDMS